MSLLPRLDAQRRAVLLVCAFAVASSTNYTSPAPLLARIAPEFDLSAAEAGLIATVFFAGTAVTALPGGLVADRSGAWRVITVGLTVVILGAFGSALLAPNFPALLAWRALGGLGGGAAFVAGARYASGIYTGRGAHMAQALYGACFLAGSGTTLFYMPLLAGESLDWRRAFLLASIGMTAVWVAWTWWAPRAPGRAVAGGGSVAVAARSRNTWLLGLAHMGGFGLAMVIGTWAPTFFIRTFGQSVGLAGALGSLTLIVGIVARTAGGVLLERGVEPRGLIRCSLAVTILGLIGMAFPLGSLPLALVALVLAGIGTGMPHAAVFNGLVVSVPRSPAAAQAIVGSASITIAIVGAPLVGALVDVTQSFAAGFGTLAVVVLLILVSTRWLRPFGIGGASRDADSSAARARATAKGALQRGAR